jgi:MFS family permease
MENRRILISGLIGGSVTAVLSSIPYLNFINCFCCIGIMLGGITSLVYYDHITGSANYVGTAQSITIGITTGLIGAFLSVIVGWLIYLNYGHWDIRFIQSVAEQMDEIPEYLEDMMNELETQAEAGYTWTSILFTNLIIFPVFCLGGSLLARVVLNKKRGHP